MINPTVGRVVLFSIDAISQPLAATIAYVHGDRLINIGYLDSAGNARSATSVKLIQDDDVKPAKGFYCEWMDYQKGQAAKTEVLEEKLSSLKI